MAKSTLNFPASPAFKDAIKVAAKERKLSGGALIREAVAIYIGFDTSNEPRIGRPPKYESKEARNKVVREKSQKRRNMVNTIKLAIARGDREDDIMALLESLDTIVK